MYTIILKTKKQTNFLEKAKAVLEANKYQEINQNTFIGQKVASTIVNQELKNIEEYKSDKGRCGIEFIMGVYLKFRKQLVKKIYILIKGFNYYARNNKL